MAVLISAISFCPGFIAELPFLIGPRCPSLKSSSGLVTDASLDISLRHEHVLWNGYAGRVAYAKLCVHADLWDGFPNAVLNFAQGKTGRGYIRNIRVNTNINHAEEYIHRRKLSLVHR